MKLINVVKAKYIEDFKLFLEFNNGVSGVVDFKPYLDGEIFEPLNDVDYFKQFELDTWTIGWDNGADYAPEFLYDLIIKQEKNVG